MWYLKMPLTYNVWKYLSSIITCFRLYRAFLPTGLRRPDTEVHVRRMLSSSMFLHAASRLRWRAAILVEALQETLLLTDQV